VWEGWTGGSQLTAPGPPRSSGGVCVDSRWMSTHDGLTRRRPSHSALCCPHNEGSFCNRYRTAVRPSRRSAAHQASCNDEPHSSSPGPRCPLPAEPHRRRSTQINGSVKHVAPTPDDLARLRRPTRPCGRSRGWGRAARWSRATRRRSSWHSVILLSKW
jgi:hypothetical protein